MIRIKCQQVSVNLNPAVFLCCSFPHLFQGGRVLPLFLNKFIFYLYDYLLYSSVECIKTD